MVGGGEPGKSGFIPMHLTSHMVNNIPPQYQGERGTGHCCHPVDKHKGHSLLSRYPQGGFDVNKSEIKDLLTTTAKESVVEI